MLTAHWRKWSFLSTQPCVGTSGALCSSIQERYGVCGASTVVGSTGQEIHAHTEEFSKGSWRWLQAMSTCHMGSGWESWDSSIWRREVAGGILSVCITNWPEAVKKTESAYSDGPSWKANGHKLRYKKFHLDVIKKFFTVEEVKHWSRLPKEVIESSSLETFKTRLKKSWEICSNWPCFKKGIG